MTETSPESTYCTNCGKDYSETACGPTHALRQAENTLAAETEGVPVQTDNRPRDEDGEQDVIQDPTVDYGADDATNG